jgi:predicted metal-binding protein
LLALQDRPGVTAAAVSSPATLLVCVTCKSDQGLLGAPLFDALSERLAGEPDIALRPIECLSVCKRPCTVALAAPGKWTYVVGDLTRESHIEEIVTAARRYAAAPDGLVPWRERPLPFRKGVISRTPPLISLETTLCK